MGSSHTLDQLGTCFDDTHAVANAGLLPPATLAERLGRVGRRRIWPAQVGCLVDRLDPEETRRIVWMIKQGRRSTSQGGSSTGFSALSNPRQITWNG